MAEPPPQKKQRFRQTVETTIGPRPVGSAPRGQENTTAFEMLARRNFAAELLEQGLSQVAVVRRLMLPPQPIGAKDAEGRPVPGGLGLTKRQAARAKNKALRQCDREWSEHRAFERTAQVIQLDAAVQGAMRERKWSAVASLATVRARITGTFTPTEVVIRPTDERRRALQDVIGKMGDAELAELLDEEEDDVRALPPRRFDA